MKYPYNIEAFLFDDKHVLLAVPEDAAVKEAYLQQQENNNNDFPYWAKNWPSSIALCEFISTNRSIVENKNVLEIAAGLGLPSLLAAGFAKQVVCTDYAAEALPFIELSAQLNRLNNVQTRLFDWNHIDEMPQTEILLLSDINYEPSAFATLYELIKAYLEKKVSILISTPQRLMAKPFIEKLLPFCVQKTTIPVKTTNEMIEIFIMQLESKG